MITRAVVDTPPREEGLESSVIAVTQYDHFRRYFAVGTVDVNDVDARLAHREVHEGDNEGTEIT